MTRSASVGSAAVCALLIGGFLAPPAYAIKGQQRGGPTPIVSGLVQRGQQFVGRLATGALGRAESRPARLGTTAQTPWWLKTIGVGAYGWLFASATKHAYEASTTGELYLFGGITFLMASIAAARIGWIVASRPHSRF
ncbi:MAG: hypothetical protein IT371_09665 [Deltaproteobacteria bacterium]|nr:hypothetical protein [Deltaproteobacteria bacterium]